MQNDTHHSIRCVSFCRVGDLFARLERCECVPVRILLRCGLNVGRQVGEEIEAGEPFDLGDGSRIVRVAIVRVLPVFHPETDRHGRRHFIRRVAPDFQQRFVVIVRYGASFAVRLRCDPGDRFVVACGLENSARHHIYRVRSRSDISDAAFELLPNTAVEFVLNLRRGIGCVIGLYDQFVRTVAVGVGYLGPRA